MIRLLLVAGLVCIVCRVLLGKWPWHYLGEVDTHGKKLAHARQVLRVGAAADAREIRDAHRREAAKVHPDRGGSTAQLQQVNAARDLLLENLPPEITGNHE